MARLPGEIDVAAYEVWSGTTYSATGMGYSLLASLPAGSTSFVHSGAGGDGTTHFYQVRALESVSGRSTPSGEQAAKLATSLSTGWNLVSAPLRLADSTLESVFARLPWTLARTYDASSREWRTVSPQRGTYDFGNLDRTMAVWLRLDAEATWEVAGILPWETEVPLEAGWNLVGYPSVVPRTVALSLADVSWSAVETFDGAPPYYLNSLAPSDLMVPGSGYWILADAPATWSVGN